IVYDFAGTPADLPSDSVIAGLYQQRDTPQTPEQIELGRKLGRLVAENLVKKLNAAGIPAQGVDVAPVPLVGDGVIRGEFVTADEGARLTRILMGWGGGAAELNARVKAYEITATGLQPLGSAKIPPKGGQLPGILVPVGVGGIAGSLAVSAAVAATTS